MNAKSASHTNGLSAEELELLAYLLEEEGVEIVEQQTIFPRQQQDDLPLSFAQQRLWFLDQLDPGITAYNTAFAIRVTGRFDVAAFERSLNEIVRRHEALRTTFPAHDGQPVQSVAPVLTVAMPVLNMQHLSEAERETEAHRQALQEVQRPFDLAHGPLIRCVLLRLAQSEHVILLTIHHIVFDGWSTGVFLQEIMALYDAFSSGKPSPLAALPIQYADFTLWQRQWLQGDLLAKQLGYWRRKLSGRRDGGSGPPVLDLPTDRPRSPRQTHRGAHSLQAFPLALGDQLRQLSQREEATMFMTLLAAFNVLLHRYSGQDDIIIGSPIANRDFVEIERLIGFFVNTLLLRADLSGDPSFRQLLRQIRETTLEAYEHQNIPFEQLVDELQTERNLSQHPLFQVMFILQNIAMPSYEREDFRMSFIQVESGAAMFDLTLSMIETPTALNAALEYNTDLFDAATMKRLLDHYQQLLAGIVADPDQPISQLPLLSEVERQQLLVEWNTTEAAYARETCAHQLFEAQAARTPEAVALVFEGARMCYRELNERANQLAHYLRARGVGGNLLAETLVGICVERSPEMIVGMLGILKAGGAYVPLDPAYPAERLAFMLNDAQAPLLLTQQRLALELPAHSAEVVFIDADWPAIARESAENLASVVTPDHLAYIIYTSGSLGQPKGVQITHTALANYISAACDLLAISSDDRVLQFASISFDTAAEEIYPCLSRGATLVLRTEALLSSAPIFLQACHDLRLTVLDLPTAYWHQLVEEIDPQQLSLLPSLRLVIIGGEQARPERLAMWQRRAGDQVRLVNTYGPTEATIVTTFWELPGQSSAATPLFTVPIGRPIHNAQVYLLDAQMQPVPVGVPGELCIGGAGLARGYLNRPALTGEKFIPNPFAAAGQRLYKSGDLARYQAAGQLEFLGRVDQQVKIRGFRVELGEIEAVLQRHPSIREIAVVAHTITAIETRLVAYIVPVAQASPDQTAPALDEVTFGVELRRWALERLPDYMIPTALVLLDALPLTPSGKIARRALPAPEGVRAERHDSYVAPRDTLELALVHIWEELLGVQPVGVHDNFFALGGHSLLVVRLMSRIQKQFGQSPSLSTLFEHATVEHLAGTLRQQPIQLPHTPVVGIQPGGQVRPFFCVHPVAGNVLCYVELANYLGSAQPFYGLQAAGLDDDQPPHTQVEEMAASYVAALRAVQPDGPYRLGGWSFGGVVAFEMAQQLYAQGQPVELLALIDSYAPDAEAESASDDVAVLAWFAHDLGRRLGKTPPMSDDDLRRIDPDRRLGYVLEQARAAGILPEDISEQHIRRALNVFAANMHAMARYRPSAYAGRVIVLRASEQPLDEHPNQTLGWDNFAIGGVEICTIPGDHYTIVSSPHVQVLAERLSACINVLPTI